MNKRKLNKIISLNKDGVSFQLCISMIIDLSKDSNTAAGFIEDFIHIRAPQIWKDLIRQGAGETPDLLTIDDK